MIPEPHRVAARRRENHETVTLVLEPVGDPIAAPAPGQFTMLWVPGVGEVPISVSAPGLPLVHTIRAVGAVTRALARLRPGDAVGVRGPFGRGWDLSAAFGRQLLCVGGGLGLAPLRSAVLAAAADDRVGGVVLLVGDRSPDARLYVEELRALERVQVCRTVDEPDARWRGPVGPVTTLLDAAPVDDATCAMVCGPEPMMVAVADDLLARGLPPGRIQVSLERNMPCGVGRCLHCQLGDVLVCRDGPVLTYDRVRASMAVPQR